MNIAQHEIACQDTLAILLKSTRPRQGKVQHEIGVSIVSPSILAPIPKAPQAESRQDHENTRTSGSAGCVLCKERRKPDEVQLHDAPHEDNPKDWEQAPDLRAATQPLCCPNGDVAERRDWVP